MSFLEKKIRGIYDRHGEFRVYLIAFVLSILGCLSLGILTLFSIFADPLQKLLDYPQSTINKIIVIHVLGLNISTPLSGFIADAKGIWILPLFSFSGYTFSFTLLKYIIKHNLHEYYTYLCFFILGCSHVSFLFSCLLNSARSLGRYYRTLAISTPNLMISISSYIQIQIITIFYSPNYTSLQEYETNFMNLLNFFMILLTSSTILSLVGSLLTDLANKYQTVTEESPEADIDDFESFNTSPLLTGAATVLHSPGPSIIGSPMPWYVDEEGIANLDTGMSMISSGYLSLAENDTPYQVKVNKFAKDFMMYPLLLCCLVAIGSTEFFIANLNAILNNLDAPGKLDSSLETMSIASTLTRFIIMLSTDYVCSRFKISRLTIFTLCVMSCGASHIYLSSSPIASLNFPLVVVSNSILNSTVFTLFPAILASIYGIEILGTTWGKLRQRSPREDDDLLYDDLLQ
ncbi:putative transporter MCH1 [Pichia kudriavzevii]|uniref:Putative transporter MCH1 n=1 Tax=Pichia kudriavzevii TaxID=4909 RepID=A0A1V2LSW0_PICKU|nr:putative transporter MCH1 [Pichia kudriavzevii]